MQIGDRWRLLRKTHATHAGHGASPNTCSIYTSVNCCRQSVLTLIHSPSVHLFSVVHAQAHKQLEADAAWPIRPFAADAQDARLRLPSPKFNFAAGAHDSHLVAEDAHDARLPLPSPTHDARLQPPRPNPNCALLMLAAGCLALNAFCNFYGCLATNSFLQLDADDAACPTCLLQMMRMMLASWLPAHFPVAANAHDARLRLHIKSTSWAFDAAGM